jgi:hypothetical protein
MLDLPSDYPFKTPECHFMTKILHPDVETHRGELSFDHGNGIGSIFGTKWRPSRRVTDVLEHLIENMRAPEWDGIGIDVQWDDIGPTGLGLRSRQTGRLDREAFGRAAKQWTNKYGTGHLLLPGSRHDGFCNTTLDAMRYVVNGQTIS